MLQGALDRARTMGPIRRFLAGLDVDWLSADIDRARAELANHEVRQASCDARLQAAQTEFARTRQDLEIQTARLAGYPTYKDCAKRLAACEERITQVEGRLREINAQIGALPSTILAKCPILATTVHRA